MTDQVTNNDVALQADIEAVIYEFHRGVHSRPDPTCKTCAALQRILDRFAAADQARQDEADRADAQADLTARLTERCRVADQARQGAENRLADALAQQPSTGGERMTVQIFKGKGLIQNWYWRLVSANGQITAQSEGYFSKWNAMRAAKKIFNDKYPIKTIYP